jgi:uncharacterized protein (TIGR02284 family)
VETYRQGLEKVDNLNARTVLQANLDSHAARAEALRRHVRQLGGEPAADSGAWGTFAAAVEGGAKLFGQSSAVAALEEGEDHGLKDYQRDLDELSPDARKLVANELLPAQRRTHDTLSRLKKIMA